MQIAKCKLQMEERIASGHWSERGFYPLLQRIRNYHFAICNLQFAILLPTLFSLSSFYIHGAEHPEAPLVGRKEPFCGAIGPGRFQVRTTASPSKLQAGDTILLTIRIQAVG